MDRKKKLLAAAAVVAIGAGAGAGIAGAGGGDDAEAPITGSALDRAEAAALEHTGEGRVTDTEVGDEESLYEVEVTLDDGTEVDVQLDADFKVVGQEAETGDEDEPARTSEDVERRDLTAALQLSGYPLAPMRNVGHGSPKRSIENVAAVPGRIEACPSV